MPQRCSFTFNMFPAIIRLLKVLSNGFKCVLMHVCWLVLNDGLASVCKHDYSHAHADKRVQYTHIFLENSRAGHVASCVLFCTCCAAVGLDGYGGVKRLWFCGCVHIRASEVCEDALVIFPFDAESVL